MGAAMVADAGIQRQYHTEASTGAAMLIFVSKCQLPERITQEGEGEPSCIRLDQFALHFVTTGPIQTQSNANNSRYI